VGRTAGTPRALGQRAALARSSGRRAPKLRAELSAAGGWHSWAALAPDCGPPGARRGAALARLGPGGRACAAPSRAGRQSGRAACRSRLQLVRASSLLLGNAAPYRLNDAACESAARRHFAHSFAHSFHNVTLLVEYHFVFCFFFFFFFVPKLHFLRFVQEWMRSLRLSRCRRLPCLRRRRQRRERRRRTTPVLRCLSTLDHTPLLSSLPKRRQTWSG
jgi:hypothetical protein